MLRDLIQVTVDYDVRIKKFEEDLLSSLKAFRVKKNSSYDWFKDVSEYLQIVEVEVLKVNHIFLPSFVIL